MVDVWTLKSSAWLIDGGTRGDATEVSTFHSHLLAKNHQASNEDHDIHVSLAASSERLDSS